MKILMILIFLCLRTSCAKEPEKEPEENFKRCIIRELDTDIIIKEETKEEKEEDQTKTEKPNENPSSNSNSNSNSKPNSSTNKKEENKTESNITKPTNPTPSKEPEQPTEVPKEESKFMMTPDEIKKYNLTIMNRTSSLYDITKKTNFTKGEILKVIENYKVPSLPKYDGQSEISSEQISQILDNRNLEEVSDKSTIQKGIVTNRTNLKSFPTDVHFFKTRGASNFDQIQETELTVNTPILILHESKDKLWYFVESKIYAGWIKKSDIAFATESDWQYFSGNSPFVVVTAPTIKTNGITLDMGVRLPLNRIVGDKYEVVIPTKKENDVAKTSVMINKTLLSEGYLPYTKENILAQAKKYIGTPYSWGGMDRGVDCSSFIMNLFRTFGFEFPRNTSSQNSSIGTVTMLSGKNANQKLDILSKTGSPAVLYQPGHTMLYIGKEGDKHYIIHASGSDLVVTKTLLNSSSYLNKIDRVVTLP